MYFISKIVDFQANRGFVLNNPETLSNWNLLSCCFKWLEVPFELKYWNISLKFVNFQTNGSFFLTNFRIFSFLGSSSLVLKFERGLKRSLEDRRKHWYFLIFVKKRGEIWKRVKKVFGRLEKTLVFLNFREKLRRTPIKNSKQKDEKNKVEQTPILVKIRKIPFFCKKKKRKICQFPSKR